MNFTGKRVHIAGSSARDARGVAGARQREADGHPEDNHVGGYIRGTIAKLSDAIVVGGGKGVVDLHRAFAELGRPVLPMGLDIRSSCNDGTARSACISAPSKLPREFFSNLPERLRAVLMTRGLSPSTRAIPTRRPRP